MRDDIERALRLIRASDDRSVERALELLQATVFSFSMKVCGHPEDAEDTAQDVLLKSLPYLPKFENAQALSVWLYKVARNRCLMNRRGKKFSPMMNVSLDELMPTGQELQELLKSDGPTPEASVLQSESRDRLKSAIQKLPSEYRFVLVLHDMEELSTAEVAKVMDLQEGTVRVRLHRARLLLRREFEAGGNAPRSTSRTGETGHKKPLGCRKLFAALSDYLDGVVDDAVCEQMRIHISDCKPCQAFLASLESVVKKCRAYNPDCTPERERQARLTLLESYHRAQRELHARRRTKAGKGTLKKRP